MRRLERRAQLGVADFGEAAPRRDARVPERFRFPEVADAGDEALIEQRIAQLSLVLRAKPLQHGVVVGRLGENVGTEASRDSAIALEDRAVEHRAHVLVASQNEPRLAEDRRVSAHDEPTSLHAQVAAQDEPALEAEEEVLADCLHVFETSAVQARRELLHGGTWMRCLDFELLTDEHLQATSGAMKGVPFGHAPRVCRLVFVPQPPAPLQRSSGACRNHSTSGSSVATTPTWSSSAVAGA